MLEEGVVCVVRMSLSKSTTRTGSGCCFICKSPEDDELYYGKLIGKWRIQVHYYCLVSSTWLIFER